MFRPHTGGEASKTRSSFRLEYEKRLKRFLSFSFSEERVPDRHIAPILHDRERNEQRTQEKSDSLDARGVALAAIREIDDPRTHSIGKKNKKPSRYGNFLWTGILVKEQKRDSRTCSIHFSPSCPQQ